MVITDNLPALTHKINSDLAGAMFTRPFIKAILQPLLKWLVLCALMLNVSVPAGAMMERIPDGQIRIVVCSAQGMLNAWLDMETGEMVEQDSEDDTDIPPDCPMASPAPMADSDASAVVIFPVRIALPYRLSIAAMAPVIGQSPARLSARGPPYLRLNTHPYNSNT